MSNQFFGEFLVSKGVINNTQLIEALIEQTEKLPTIAKLIKDSGELNPDQILKIFNHQQVQNIDFKSAAISLGFWNEKTEQLVKKRYEEIRIPLGQILINKSLVDVKKLTLMLDDYLSQVQPVKNQIDDIKNEDVASLEPAPELQENKMQFHASLSDFFERYDERKKKVIKVALSLIKSNTENDPERALKLFQDAFKLIHSLTGLVNLYNIPMLEEFLTKVEQVANLQIEFPSQDFQKNCKVADILMMAIDETWSIREFLTKNNNLDNYLNNDDDKNRFNELNAEMDFILMM